MPYKHPPDSECCPRALQCSGLLSFAPSRFNFFFFPQPGPAMVTGFPGKSDCCIFPAVKEQQVTGSLTPSPEPLGTSASLDVEGLLLSRSNTRKAIVHCQVTAASQQDTAVTQGVPEDSPNCSPGAQVRLMGLSSHIFGDKTKLRAAGCKPSQPDDHPPASLGARVRPGEPHGAAGSGAKPLSDSLSMVFVPLHSHFNSSKLLVMSRVSL